MESYYEDNSINDISYVYDNSNFLLTWNINNIMSISHISNLRQPLTAKPPKSTKDSAKDSASTNWTYDFERMGEPSHFVRRRTSSAHCGIDFTEEFDGSDVVFKVKS